MQYKNTEKIIIDGYKLKTLFRLGCPDSQILELLKTGKFTPTGDSLIDETLECLVDRKVFNNWGGIREGAGRKSRLNQDENQLDNQLEKKSRFSGKNNQLENQDENQLENQDGNQVEDKDRDNIYFNNNNIINNNNINNNINTRVINKKIPTLDEFLTWAKQQNDFAGVGGFKCSKTQAEQFWHHYSSQGWVTANNIPIADWQSKFREWCVKDKQRKDDLC